MLSPICEPEEEEEEEGYDKKVWVVLASKRTSPQTDETHPGLSTYHASVEHVGVVWHVGKDLFKGGGAKGGRGGRERGVEGSEVWKGEVGGSSRFWGLALFQPPLPRPPSTF